MMIADDDGAERSRAALSEYLRGGGVVPCQFMPSSAFFHRAGVELSRADMNDVIAAMDACHSCPVRDSCASAGSEEMFGIWGGVQMGHTQDGDHDQ